jgi:hypothetical protein
MAEIEQVEEEKYELSSIIGQIVIGLLALVILVCTVLWMMADWWNFPLSKMGFEWKFQESVIEFLQRGGRVEGGLTVGGFLISIFRMIVRVWILFCIVIGSATVIGWVAKNVLPSSMMPSDEKARLAVRTVLLGLAIVVAAVMMLGVVLTLVL